MSETAVTSFVIRFIQDQEPDAVPTPWRGIIRHVQSREEMHFTRMEEALNFMTHYVDETGSQRENPDSKRRS